MNHLTVTPTNAAKNQEDNNRKTHEFDSVHELRGFARAMCKGDTFSYDNITLSYDVTFSDE